MPNRLLNEKSPYLLQHANNPVNWYPWGEEAFEKARTEDKPVFLSVGYATCHWCHVMERECFEDLDVARVLNDYFVAVKVDREERPDVDQIYMSVCQALTGRGGWPLSVLMTPEGKPFFAGTYFPKTSRMGMPGFLDILLQVAGLWKNDRNRLSKIGQQVTHAIQPKKSTANGRAPDLELLRNGYLQLQSAFDERWGGFGGAPKFPTPHHLTFLLRWHRRNPGSEALKMVEKTLQCMRDGGIFDHLGYGFHRYSVDERWLVPHFEKMLYDQAMLAMAYTEAFQVTGHPAYSRVVREILEYVLRDMTHPHGGFYSAEDADSQGEEGLFYVWTPQEIRQVLGEEKGEIFCSYYDISASGNFENGMSILHVSRPYAAVAQRFGMNVDQLKDLLQDCRRRLFDVREGRIHPLKDDKILTSWNGLMIAALARAYQVLHDPGHLEGASRAAHFVLDKLRDSSGRLYRRYREGEAAHRGYADDHAFFIWGLLELYEATFETPYLEHAISLQQVMLEHFWDEESHGFRFSADDGEQLIVNDREIYDGATPSSNSVAALNLMRLGRLTGNVMWEERADRVLKAFSGLVGDYPSAYTQFLNAVDFSIGPNKEVVFVGERGDSETEEMIRFLHTVFDPGRVTAFKDTSGQTGDLGRLAPHAAALEPVHGKTAVYICENHACRQPLSGLAELRNAFLADGG